MPLFLHSGNRLEDLADALIADWQHDPVPPLATRPLVVESGSLGQWVRQRLCERQGVAMLIDTPLPAAWLWQAALETLGLPADEDPLSRERMQWRLHHLLGSDQGFLNQQEAASLRTYLQDADELKRWQLAGRIADVFDRYQYHRPELIRAWNSGDFAIGEWQGPLWQRLASEVPWQRVTLLDRFIERLGDPAPAGLPPRVDLFSLHALPRLLLETWVALSRHSAVHLWVLSPTDQYWADLASPRQLARQRLEAPEAAELWQLGHPLLTRWGRQGQVFQDMLLEATAELSIDEDNHTPPRGNSLLHRLQAEIFTAESPDADRTVAEEDPRLPSIQFHVCHSAMRECQVLHDTLLHCLQADPTLRPEDILVMAPEISRYAPYIEAVFGNSGHQAPILPFNLSDVTRADEHPLTRAFLSLLALPTARFTRAEVVALLHLPEVQAQQGLNEEDVAGLVETLDTLRTYWGLDAEDKRQRLDLPAIPDNTWQQAFERLMAGYALGSDRLHGDIAPLAATGSQLADRAARLFDLLELLREASRTLARPADARTWARRLMGLTHRLFGEDRDDSGRLDRIHEAIAELAVCGELHPGPLGLAVVRHWLAGRLGNASHRDRPYSGGITFCALKPLRGVPFRVICLLGMQEKAFPRRHAAPDFDQMAHHWRHGDPQPGQEDRYLFLETLLAARERLILSWTGRDPRSNEPLQPSVVIDELREHLDRHYCLADGRRPGEAILREHPLQPFSARNFAGDLPGFDRWWCQTAITIDRHRAPEATPGWPQILMPLPASHERRVTPAALGHFLRDPARQFVLRRLRLGPPDDAPLAEDEPIEADGLIDWGIRQYWLAAWLYGEDEASIARRLRAEGRLLHGVNGQRQLERLRSDIPALDDPALPFAPPLSRAVRDGQLEIACGETAWQLEGRLEHYHRDRHGQPLLVSWSASRFHHADLLPLWVEHLCLHAEDAGERACETWYLARDGVYRLLPVQGEQARDILGDLLDLYQRGLQTPLPFLRKSSSAWIAAADDEAKALSAALKAWHGGYRQEGEKAQAHCRILLAGRDWEPDAAFAGLARDILGPLAAHLEEPS